MGGSLVLTTSTLLGFLLTLARVAGAFIFVPMPGLRTGFDLARTVLTVSITIALFAQWPQVPADTSIGVVAAWMVGEAGLGIGIGLAVAFVTEAFGVGAQIMGLQAGYAYASTIDPSTQADSGILVIFAQLASGLLFFTLGLDREVLRIFAHSLEVMPPGSILISRGAGEHLLSLGATMFSTGLRLALPVVAILVLVDVSLALLGRINSQLQLLTVAFPIKMMVGLFVLSWVALLLPTLFRIDAAITLAAIRNLAGR
jgi:flagellar biosynthetic protein FliR